MAQLLWEAGTMQSHTWSCAKLGQLFSSFQCPPHSGMGLPWFSSHPNGNYVIQGWETNINAPSATLAPAFEEACGKVALCLLCTGRRTCCSWEKGTHMVCAWFITILEKGNSEMCIINLIYAHWEQILGWLFPLAVLNFSLKMRGGKLALRERSKHRHLQIRMHEHVIHLSSDLQSALHNMVSYYLELNFSTLSKFPRAFLSVSVRCPRGFYRKY